MLVKAASALHKEATASDLTIKTADTPASTRLFLEAACRQARAWRDAGVPCPRVAVNVAAIQIERSDLPATVQSTLQRHGLPAECLELEVTESVLMRNADHARKTLDAIKALGVTVAIDDFGTGYSSLAYLKALPIDKLKIDRSFVGALPHDSDVAAIARAVIDLGRHLGYQVVAEGVETEEHLEFLRAHGCEGAQGYWFSRPLPPDEFERWTRDQNAATNQRNASSLPGS